VATALFAGLMSGTSMDGVDAALCAFEDDRFVSVLELRHTPYADSLRDQLLKLQHGTGGVGLRSIAALDQSVALAFAGAAQAICAGRQVTAIGSHGQTVFHDPDGLHNSIQLGNPGLIAVRAGVPVVADFRRADIALGGQGAPLVPAFHQAVLGRADEARGVLNIGGIANLSVLPDGDTEPVRGWDTGPGNALMDEWVQQHRKQRFDANGEWASRGLVDEDLLYALQRDSYFTQPPPKSTGRGYFNLAWARARFRHLEHIDPANVQRTFCELTARTISDDVSRLAPLCRRILVCGGGARNGMLMSRLRELLAGRALELTDAHGLAAEAVEAAAFAWLAMRRSRGLSGNLPEVTGASRPAILGGLYLP
jgi:anhydro-N-acetylmuramic acid kinase